MEFRTIIWIFLTINCCCNASLVVQKCCSFGASLGADGKDCLRIQPLSGLADAEEKLCKQVAQFCCDRERLLLDCKLGVVFAKTYHHCMLDNSTNGCSGQAETCCSACLLAENLAKEKLPCQVPGASASTLSQVFLNCCQQTNPPENEEKDFENYDEDVSKNLCQMLPGQLCAHICIPTTNSYYCQCREGFSLMEDQKTCQPEKLKPKPQAPSVIVPNPEKPVPLMKPRPYIPQTPISKLKCEENTSCEQECINTASGQICACRTGFELHVDRIHCKDINECLDNIHVCDPVLEICKNEIGSYKCENNPVQYSSSPPPLLDNFPSTRQAIHSTEYSTPSTTERSRPDCAPGLEVLPSGVCADIDECDSTQHPEVCEPLEVCINTIGSYECRCQIGYQKETRYGPCIDINECQQNSHRCQPETRCDNTIGSYVCHRIAGCGTGYTLNANTGLCEDDDECLLGTDNCRISGMHCRNTNGSFRCERKWCSPHSPDCDSSSPCPRGYEESPLLRQCVDVDECKTRTHNCNPETQICVNRRGSFDCRRLPSCPPGYEASESGCKDIDECVRNTHNCDRNSVCRNQMGGFFCDCLPGYRKGANNDCQDLDECSLYGCPQTADCQNTPGSYRCNCKRGFSMTIPNYCQDVDECANEPGLCEHNCVNSYGSFYCTCPSGFLISQNNRSCEDIDECNRFRDQKLCNGECVNIPGSFRCSCPPGYSLGADDRTCQDIDECARNPCRGSDEVCLNTGGGFECNSIACPPGYTKDTVQRNRCRRTACRTSPVECMKQVQTISFNFITFVSMLPIPPSGHLDLFALRGPTHGNFEAKFDLNVKNVNAPPHVEPASIENFHLRRPSWDQAVVALQRPIPGPQKIELELTASMYQNGGFSGKALSRLFIHVSRYEY